MVRDTWPGFPAPQDVTRDDGEIVGRLVPTAGGWRATTTFGAPLSGVTTREAALETAHAIGLSSLAEPWWVREVDETRWREAALVDVRPTRIRLRWSDPMVEQNPSGQWFDLVDIELTRQPPPG